MLSFKFFIFFIIIVVIIGILFIFKSAQLPIKIRRAEEYLSNGDYQKAGEILREVLEIKNNYVPARFLRSQVLINQKQYLLAISELNGILSISDYNNFVSEQEIRNKLAELYNETGQWQKEILEYKTILTLEPDNIIANMKIGQVLFKEKEYEDAKKYLTKAIDLDSSQTNCYLPLGISLFFLSEYNKAEQYLNKAIDSSQGEHEAYYYLGLINSVSKNYDVAIRMFENSKNDNRYFIKSLYNLGEIYFNNSIYDKAIEILKTGVYKLNKEDEESIAYRYLLAECYEMDNQLKEALYQWESIAKSKPDYRDTRFKIDEYKAILDNDNLKILFTYSLKDLQRIIIELINMLNYSIISKQELNNNEYLYRAFNSKRVNNPPALIYFHRTTREITVEQINDFYKKLDDRNCNNSIYIATTRFAQKAMNIMVSKNIELIDSIDLTKMVEKIRLRKPI